jgi:pimeloyl-ACP methyl ester carboxylesterase
MRLFLSNLNDELRNTAMNRYIEFFLINILIILLLIGCAKQQEEPAIIFDSAVSADGVSIGYQVQGQGEPALIFIHGWCCDRTYWEAQLSHFAQKYKVVAIDLAGHGESGLERKNYTMRAFGEDVVAVINKLELDQVVLIGHSMGGAVILEAARHIPERVIGLVGADTLDSFEFNFTQEQIDEMLKPVRSNFPEATSNFVRTMMFTPNSDPVLVEKIVADMSSASPEVGISSMEGYFSFWENELLQVVQEVQAPLTCINAPTGLTNVEGNQQYMPSFKAKIMSGVGHFVMMEDPETFNRLLDGAIQEFITLKTSE